MVAGSEIIKDAFGAGGLRRTTIDALDALRLERDADVLQYDRRTRQLTEQLLGGGRTDQGAIGFVLLLRLVVQWEARRQQSGAEARQAHEKESSAVLPLGWLHKEIGSRANQDLGQLLSWMLRDLVIGQSLRVALRKPGDRFFLARDEEGFRVIRESSVRSDFEYDASRIKAALRLMRDLALANLENGSLRLTAEGNRLCAELLDFHARS